MRPVAEEQDVLRFPLNQVLGTEAQVRLVRVLANQVLGPVSAPEAAEQAGITPAGARRALANLVRSGCVRRIGRGRSQQFELRDDAPLAPALRLLFRAEEDRYQELLAALREVLGTQPAIRVAWIETLPAEPSDALHVGMVAGTREIAAAARGARQHLAELETRFDLTIELHPFTQADAPEVSWDRAVLLAGAPLSGGVGTGSPPDHRGMEERALDLARGVRRLLQEDPTLRARALRHVERLLEDPEPHMARHDLEAWGSILERYSPERLGEFIVSDSPRAQTLRQSSPFLAVLTPEERDVVRRGGERGR